MAAKDDPKRDLEIPEARKIPELKKYHVSELYGFLLKHPLQKLPSQFEEWNHLIQDLPSLIKNKTLRDVVKKMPEFNYNLLQCHREWRLAHLMLGAIISGYVYMTGVDNPDSIVPKVLPQCLAVPFWNVCKHLGLPPGPSVHCSLALANWKLVDPKGPFDMDNLSLIVNIYGSVGETWFFVSTMMVEFECVLGINSIVKAQKAVHENNQEELALSLKGMSLSLLKMKRTLTRMHEKLGSEDFYNFLRPFLMGWDSPPFQEQGGMIYEGISNTPLKISGGSAGQSAILFCFDEALGIKHPPERENVRGEFFKFLLPSHQDFITAIKKGPSIRDFVLMTKNQNLKEEYNKCLMSLKDFRSYHIQLVTKYIIIPSHQNKSLIYQKQGNAGTGGTAIFPFLKGLRTSTEDKLLLL